MAKLEPVEVVPIQQEIVIPQEAIRRFELPDLTFHHGWFTPRFTRRYPHLSERQMIAFLKDMIYNNEHYFLFHEHAVGLFQAVNSHALDADPVIWERFVWAQDKSNPAHIAACAEMYSRVKKWAQQKGIDRVHVDEATDVPMEEIAKRFNRISQVVQKVARL